MLRNVSRPDRLDLLDRTALRTSFLPLSSIPFYSSDPALRPTAAELVTHEYLVLPSFWVFPGFPKQEEGPSIWDIES